jgi:hypothetical protein
MARLINHQSVWVAMRGGSLTKEYQVSLSPDQGMAVPLGEAVMIRLSDPNKVDIAFGRGDDNDGGFSALMQLPYTRGALRLGVPASKTHRQWIDIDKLWKTLVIRDLS